MKVPVVLLAFGAGLSVASLYYAQPILHALAQELGASPERIGLVPTATQLGYAFGLIAFAPLGDTLERRALIVAKCAALALALVTAALAPSLWAVVAASAVIGFTATVAQDFVPAAATLAPAASRGRLVGMVMTGLLLGILLSRTVSGFVGEHLGWRAVFLGAALSVTVLALISRLRLPRLEPTTRAPYLELLGSMAKLLRESAPLRRAALTQGLLSLAFGGFWSTLALGLAAEPFGLGSTAAGAFGLAGAAGALIAPFAGAIADRRGPQSVIRLGAALTAASYALMAVWPASLPILVLGTLVFDLGTQASLVSHQSIIYSLEPSARSRLNAILVACMFVGMATGSAAASRLLGAYGFHAVTAACAGAALMALGVTLRAAPAAPAASPRS